MSIKAVGVELPSGTAVRVSTPQSLLLRLPSSVAPLRDPIFLTFNVASSKADELASLLEQVRELLASQKA